MLILILKHHHCIVQDAITLVAPYCCSMLNLFITMIKRIYSLTCMIVDLGLKATIVQLPIQKYLIGCKYYFVNVTLECLARNSYMTIPSKQYSRI